jgi:hypothetical protein
MRHLLAAVAALIAFAPAHTLLAAHSAYPLRQCLCSPRVATDGR